MNKICLHTNSNWYGGQKEFEPPRKDTWEWIKTPPQFANVHIFEDLFLRDHINYNNVIKIAFIGEAPEIYEDACRHNPTTFNPYTWILDNYQHFDYVMSTFTFLENLFPDKFFWVPAASSRIMRHQIGRYEKNRNISIISSYKTWTVGHRMRHEFIKKFDGIFDFDVYGNGYNKIIDEVEGGRLISLAPYRYNICIMNSIEDDFFSEHVTDVFAVGTIPIVWATKNLYKYFNPNGFIEFNDLDELTDIIPTLTPELYDSKIDAVNENIELSKKYMNIPDYIYENYKDKLESL